MKREIQLYDFKIFGRAIKEARNEHKMSRKDVSDRLDISPRYLASIENNGQHPSLQIFYELVTLLDISVDQFFFSNKNEIILQGVIEGFHKARKLRFDLAVKCLRLFSDGLYRLKVCE